MDSNKRQKRRPQSLEKKQSRAGYVFILPWVVGFLFFFLKPFAESFWFTFNDVTMTATGLSPAFLGLSNYKYLLFQDSKFLRTLFASLGSMVTEVVIITIFSLFVATILNHKFKGRIFYRAVFFLPIILTSGVVFTMMSGVIGGGMGSASSQNAYLFKSAGLQTILLQGGLRPSAVTFITGIVDSIFALVTKAGVQILLFLSGLQKIPSDFYEAAQIEGASKWDIFWKITIPRIAPIIFLNIVYTIIDSFTSYGSASGANQMMEMIRDMGFGKTMKFGLSAAMAWMYFAVIALLLFVVYMVVGRKTTKVDS